MCVKGLSTVDSITISMKSAAAIRSVLTTFLALPVVGPIRSTSIMRINKAVIRSLSTSFTTFEESEWKNRSRNSRVRLSRNCGG